MTIYYAFLLAFLHMGSYAAARMLIVLYALKLGAQPVAIGLLAAMFTLCPMLLSWRVGRIVDRYGPRRLMTMGATGSALGLLLPYFFPSLPSLFVLAAGLGLSSTFLNLSMQNLVGRLSDATTRTRNFSNVSMTISVSNVAGPTCAGFAIDYFGHAYTFLGVFSAVALLVLLLFAHGHVLPAGRRDGQPPRGVRHLITNPLLWPVMVASCSAQSGLDVMNIYMPVYGNSLGMSATQIGVIVSMSAVGGFASRILLTRLVARSSEISVLGWSLLLGGFSFVMVPLTESALLLSTAALAFGFGVNCSQPLVLSLLFNRSPEGQAGEALGLRFSIDNGLKCVGPVFYGLAASALGVGFVFWINAAMLASGGLIARLNRGPRRGRAETERAA